MRQLAAIVSALLAWMLLAEGAEPPMVWKDDPSPAKDRKPLPKASVNAMDRQDGGKRLGAEKGYVSEEGSRRVWMPQRFEEIEEAPDGKYKVIDAGTSHEMDCWAFVFPAKDSQKSISEKLPYDYRIFSTSTGSSAKFAAWVDACKLNHCRRDVDLKRRPLYIAGLTFKPSENPVLQKNVQEIMALAQKRSIYRHDLSIKIAACGGSLEWEGLLEKRFLFMWDEIEKGYRGNEQPLRDVLSALEATDWMPDNIRTAALCAIASADHPFGSENADWPGFCNPVEYKMFREKNPPPPGRSWPGPPSAELVAEIMRFASLPSTSPARRAWAWRALANMAEANPDIAKIAIPYILSHNGFDSQLARKKGWGRPSDTMRESMTGVDDSCCQSNLILSLGLLGMHASVKKDKAVLTILRDELLKELKSASIYKIGNAMRIIICSQMLWSDEKLRAAVAPYEKDTRSLKMEPDRPGPTWSSANNETAYLTQDNTFMWEAKGHPQLRELANDVMKKILGRTAIIGKAPKTYEPLEYVAPEDM